MVDIENFGMPSWSMPNIPGVIGVPDIPMESQIETCHGDSFDSQWLKCCEDSGIV